MGKVIKWNDFYSKKEADRKNLLSPAIMTGEVVTLATLLITGLPIVAQASAGDAIARAMNPIVDILQGLAYPTTLAAMFYGALLVIIGQRSTGLGFCKGAAIGYLLVQFVPGIMLTLKSAGAAIK